MPSSTDYSAVRDDLAHQSPEAISRHVRPGRRPLRHHESRHGRRPRSLLALAARPRRRRATTRARARSRHRQRRRPPRPATPSRLHRIAPSAPISACPCCSRPRPKKPANLLVGDGLHLPFPDASFDAVTIAWGLRNFADRLAGLREMRRVLRPGGRAYVLEFSTPARGSRRSTFGTCATSCPSTPSSSRPSAAPTNTSANRSAPSRATRAGRHDARGRIRLGPLDEPHPRHRRAACRRGIEGVESASRNPGVSQKISFNRREARMPACFFISSLRACGPPPRAGFG